MYKNKRIMLTGIIYKIQHISKPEILYIGSTTQTLNARWKKHLKRNSKCSIKPYMRKYKAINFVITELKRYLVCDAVHLRAYEQLYLNTNKCINKRCALRFYFKRFRDKTNI